MTKLKAFGDDKINVAQITISVFNWVDNIVGKGENACFSPFTHNVYKKVSFFTLLRSGLCSTELKQKLTLVGSSHNFLSKR